MPFFTTIVAYLDEITSKSASKFFIIEGEGTYRQSAMDDFSFKILGFSLLSEPTGAEEAVLSLKDKNDKIALISGKWGLFGDDFQVSCMFRSLLSDQNIKLILILKTFFLLNYRYYYRLPKYYQWRVAIYLFLSRL